MIEYRSDPDGLVAADLEPFFIGWPIKPSPSRVLRALKRASSVLVARLASTGRVIGFGYTISDRELFAFLPLVEVLPEHRGQGIGSEIVKRLMQAESSKYAFDLVCDPDLVPFYERLGLQELSAMATRNRAALERP